MTDRRPPSRGRAVVILVVALVVVGSGVPRAAADGGGGASSRVTIDGDILTAILAPAGPRRPTTRRPGHGTAPDITWRTLSFGEIEFLLRLAARDPSLVANPVLDAVDRIMNDPALADADLQLAFDNGRPTTAVRIVAAPAGGSATRALARQMVTRLPVPVFRTSPPAGQPVPVREPVFVSFDDAAWQAGVDESISANGITARVRAHPIHSTVWSGDPSVATGDHSDVTRCGQGVPFDPHLPASPAAQARMSGRCTVVYETVTGIDGRRDRWYGLVTVVWHAEWSIDGVTWQDLGDIPKLTLMARQVTQFGTRIESPPRPSR